MSKRPFLIVRFIFVKQNSQKRLKLQFQATLEISISLNVENSKVRVFEIYCRLSSSISSLNGPKLDLTIRAERKQVQPELTQRVQLAIIYRFLTNLFQAHSKSHYYRLAYCFTKTVIHFQI